MRNHTLAIAIGLAFAASGCASSAQQANASPLASAQCGSLSNVDGQIAELYAPGNVQRVEPIHRNEFRARAVNVKYVSGAKLYVPAQQGMSAPYLERVLTCHARGSSTAQPNDPTRVSNVRDVDVVARGPNYVIQIEGSDRASGKEIFERAQQLRGNGNVEVRQLSSGTDSGAKL